MTIADIRETARALFLTGVRAADPAQAVKRELTANPLERAPNGRLIIVAFGKAACAMMEQSLRHVPKGQAVQAIAVTNDENARKIDGCKVRASGHPLPDQRGIDAGRDIMQLIGAATQDDRVLCLVSGGGSALLPTPRDGLSLDDKIKVNELLLSGGLDIIQMNVVRQQLSVLKGGGLLDMAHPAKVRSLIISDVVGDDIGAIASGPTAPVLDQLAETLTILRSRGIWSKLPASAQNLLVTPMLATPRTAQNTIVCSNLQSLQTIADASSDWSPQIVSHQLTGDVQAAARAIVDCARKTPIDGKQLLIWGGETTVDISGDGRGGRNQELAVHVSALASDLPGQWVFLSGGTDGRDGPTDAAGGLVTAGTIARSQAQNVNVIAALEDNDSYRILDAAGDLLVIGGTGTNVADIQLLLRTA